MPFSPPTVGAPECIQSNAPHYPAEGMPRQNTPLQAGGATSPEAQPPAADAHAFVRDVVRDACAGSKHQRHRRKQLQRGAKQRGASVGITTSSGELATACFEPAFTSSGVMWETHRCSDSLAQNFHRCVTHPRMRRSKRGARSSEQRGDSSKTERREVGAAFATHGTRATSPQPMTSSCGPTRTRGAGPGSAGKSAGFDLPEAAGKAIVCPGANSTTAQKKWHRAATRCHYSRSSPKGGSMRVALTRLVLVFRLSWVGFFSPW